MPSLIYGVRGPDPRNTVVEVPSRGEAEDMLTPGDVLMVKTGSCPHTNACRCPGGWRDTAVCRNCGQEITTSAPYLAYISTTWNHAEDGSWNCPDGSENHAEPRAEED